MTLKELPIGKTATVLSVGGEGVIILCKWELFPQQKLPWLSMRLWEIRFS